MTTENISVTVNNAALAATIGVKEGDVVSVPCRNGVPTQREWRNRLRDAGIDGCVSVNEVKQSKKEAK